MTKNITLAVEDEIIDEVRILAAEKKTTVNAMVREFLTSAVARRRALRSPAELSRAEQEQDNSNGLPQSTLPAHENCLLYIPRGVAVFASWLRLPLGAVERPLWCVSRGSV